MGSNPVRNTGETTMEIKYEGKEHEVQFKHEPDYTRKSQYNGLAVIVGRTTASIQVNGKAISAVAECWVRDRYTEFMGEFVSVGRLQKQLGIQKEKRAYPNLSS